MGTVVAPCDRDALSVLKLKSATECLLREERWFNETVEADQAPRVRLLPRDLPLPELPCRRGGVPRRTLLRPGVRKSSRSLSPRRRHQFGRRSVMLRASPTTRAG